MPGRGNPKVVVRFDAETLEQLQAAARELTSSKLDGGLSAVVRQAVKEWLGRRAGFSPPVVAPERPPIAVARIRRPQPDQLGRTVDCVTCGAPPGSACYENGRSRRPHRERMKDARLAARPDHEVPTPPKKVMRVKLWLCVERNSKFVRGMKKAREEIEYDILRRYGMKKLDKDGYEYHLTIPYETDAELDEIVNEDILREAERTADLRHCFIEADAVSLDDPSRTWP